MASLEVTVVSCQRVKGGDLFSEADPYVVLKLGKQMHRTQVQLDAGENAEFHETFHFQSASSAVSPLDLVVYVYDKDFIFNQRLGKGSINLTDVLAKGYWMGDVQMVKGREQNGSVTIVAKTTKPSGF